MERPTLSMHSEKVKGLLMCFHGCEPCDWSVRKVLLKCPGHREEDTALAQDSRACGPVGWTDVAGSNANCCCGLNAGLSHEVRVTAHSVGQKLWKSFSEQLLFCPRNTGSCSPGKGSFMYVS